MRPPPGFTLTELIVVISVLGLAAGTAGLALNAAFASREGPDGSIGRARALAVVEGRPHRLEINDSTGAWLQSVLVLPDGRVLGGSVDPLTGEAAYGR